jgi:hypothetical protein
VRTGQVGRVGPVRFQASIVVAFVSPYCILSGAHERKGVFFCLARLLQRDAAVPAVEARNIVRKEAFELLLQSFERRDQVAKRSAGRRRHSAT